MTAPVRVLIVDDQAMVRAGLRVILEHEPDMDVVGEADEGRAAHESARATVPDVVLMDIRMPGTDGITATRAITTDLGLGGVRVIALTTFDDDEYLAGASGFLLKDASPDELLNAIRRVHAGHALLDPSMTRRVLDRWITAEQSTRNGPQLDALLERLSPREVDVWRLVATGASNRQIATALYLTEGTVKTHVHSILMKLDTTSRTVLVALAYESGLITPGERA